MALQPFVGPWPLLKFQSVGLLEQEIGPSHTQNNTNRKNTHNTEIHASSGIRTHDPSVRASEDSSRFRPRGHSDQPLAHIKEMKLERLG
jgi:hypothetical protein